MATYVVTCNVCEAVTRVIVSNDYGEPEFCPICGDDAIAVVEDK